MKNYKNFTKINEANFQNDNDEKLRGESEKEKAESVDKNIHLSNKYFDDLDRISKIVRSCETEEQTETAYNVYNLWKKKWINLFVKPIPYYFMKDVRMIEELLGEKFKEFNEPI